MGIFGKNPPLGEEQVLQALAAVKDPILQESIVSLDFVKEISTEGRRVQVRVQVASPSESRRQEVSREVEAALLALNGVESVEVETEFLVTSKSGAEAHPLIPKVKNTIAVASGKGGVGKSTVAANLATALTRFGARVGLMDADVYGPSIPILMGAFDPPRPTQAGIIPPERHNIKLISIAYFLPKDKAVIWRGPMLHKTVQQFLGQVTWGELDYLVIDLPPGTGDIQLSLCQTIPLTGAVVVSTPQDLALEVASKAIAMFRQLNTPVLGLVENMSYYQCPHCGERDDIFGHGGAQKASAEMGYPYLGAIPLSSVVRSRSDQGQPVALQDDTPFAELYRQVAVALAEEVNRQNHSEGAPITIEQ